MPSMQGPEAVEKRNIAELSDEFNISLEEVRMLYEAQRTRLMSGAKVGKYFPIFAVRSIRQQLASRKLGHRQAPKPTAR
jgi:hypothetical protein